MPSLVRNQSNSPSGKRGSRFRKVKYIIVILVSASIVTTSYYMCFRTKEIRIILNDFNQGFKNKYQDERDEFPGLLRNNQIHEDHIVKINDREISFYINIRWHNNEDKIKNKVDENIKNGTFCKTKLISNCNNCYHYCNDVSDNRKQKPLGVLCFRRNIQYRVVYHWGYSTTDTNDVSIKLLNDVHIMMEKAIDDFYKQRDANNQKANKKK